MTELVRCGWAMSDELYVKYHDEEWGVPVHDDRDLFERLMLEGFQAGLSWRTILNKREHFFRAFDGWDPEVIANYGPDKIAELLNDPGIVRNRLKVNGAVRNAQAYLRIVAGEGSFDTFIWSFTGAPPSPMPTRRPSRTSRPRPPNRTRCRRTATPRLHLRRLDHLLRLHAKRRHGQRPRHHLLPRRGGGVRCPGFQQLARPTRLLRGWVFPHAGVPLPGLRPPSPVARERERCAGLVQE